MNFKAISTFLMIVLIGLLIGILIRYYNTPIRTSKTTTELQISNYSNSSANSNTNPNPKPQNPIPMDEKQSGEIVSGSTTSNNEPRETMINDKGEMNNTVIIQSEDTMTNKEKREILTELDNTLMELLDVVEKVQTVDETRLPTESEVQQ